MAVTPERPPIRTFRRRGRMTAAKHAAIATIGPRFIVGHDEPFDANVVFGRHAPLVVDIGFGDGEATAQYATMNPDRGVLAAEVHRPGIATLLGRVDEQALTNVRIWEGDALDLVARLAPATVTEIHAYFPDPWPKVRHHERRLVSARVVRRWCEVLVPGGVIHVATDLPDYEVQMRTVFATEPAIADVVDDRAERPMTKYERLALAAGRTVVDLRARRR